MSWSQADLDALDEAMKTGADEVQYRDKKVKYRSLKDMMQLRNMIARELGLTDSSSSRVYPTLSKGFIPGGNGFDSGGGC